MTSSHKLQSPIGQSYSKKEDLENTNSKSGLRADSKGGGEDEESSNNVRNKEEPLEVDGGLGSSVCGEDLMHRSNLGDAVMTNQQDIGKFLN